MSDSIQLSALLADLPGLLASVGAVDPAISCIVADSRQAAPGALFVAYRGVDLDSHRYIPEAIKRGAAAIVGEQPSPGDYAVPYVQVADGRAALAWLSAAWCGHPSRSMALVGITGTDGKTTTATILHSVLRAAGRRTGLISTVSAIIGDVEYDTGLHTTTPDAPDVQHYLSQMRAAGTEIVVLETTSHGLAQHRVTGCAFDVAVVTNITHEHLDFHGSYDAYRAAKALLFRSLLGQKPGRARKPGFPQLPKTAVLNRDDSAYAYLAAIAAERTITYGLGRLGGEADRPSALHLTAVNICHTSAGTEFDVVIFDSGTASAGGAAETAPHPSVPVSPVHFSTSLVGDFNVYNILAAAGAALALAIDPVAIRAGVAAVKGVPGRMERIDRGQDFLAIVDFAHTPNALARALETAQGLVRAGGRVIAVFGSAGLRDRAKRRLMGSAAAAHADLAVITAEDPRTEPLAEIMAETAQAMAEAGWVEGRDFVRIADRQAAILYAVQQAAPGDVVLVCGKGHEQSMCFATVEHPWQDQDALRWALDRRRGCGAPEPPYVLPTWTST